MARSGFPYTVPKHKLSLSLSSSSVTVHREGWWWNMSFNWHDTVLHGLIAECDIVKWQPCARSVLNLGGHRVGAPESRDCTLTTCQRWYCSASPPSWPCSVLLFGRQQIRLMTVTSIMHGTFRWLQILHWRKLDNEYFQKCFKQLYSH
jgi:hypothetical protein